MNNEKKDAFAAYHIKQSLGLAGQVFMGLIGMIPVLGWIINVRWAYLVLLLYVVINGLMNASMAKKALFPFLGKNFLEWFKKFKYTVLSTANQKLQMPAYSILLTIIVFLFSCNEKPKKEKAGAVMRFGGLFPKCAINLQCRGLITELNRQ